MWKLSFLLFVILQQTFGSYGQTINGCPTGWEEFGDKCYHFAVDEKIFDEADAWCWVNGSKLVTIEGHADHQYISTWLITHELGTVFSEQPVWFTSGSYHFNRSITWDSDTVLQTNGETYWVSQNGPDRFSPFTRIAYIFEGGRYSAFGWDVVSASVPSNFICQMDKGMTQEVKILQRGFDYGLGEVDYLQIKKGPVIIQEPTTVVVFGAASSAYIECGALANPYPTFGWVRDGNTTITSDVDNRYTLSGGRFSVQNPDDRLDIAAYQCVVTNTFGTIMSRPAKLLFGYVKEFSPVKQSDVYANKFEGTRISCNGPTAYPEARYQWYQWTPNEFIFQEHNYMFVSSSGYLYFSEVQPTDHRQYFCVVTVTASMLYNKANSQPPSRNSLGVWLVVQGTEHGTFQPIIYNHVFPSPPIRGSRIIMECIAYGTLPLIYSWHRKDGRPFKIGTKMSDLNRVLTIENAQLDEEGDYVCVCSGKGGVTSKVVTLSIEARPYFPFGIGDRFVDPRQNLNWRCKAVARPGAVYQWYKNGELIQNVPGHIAVNGNFLQISNIQEEDEGMYQCSATNLHGTSFSSGQLKVLSFAPSFSRYPLSLTTLAPLGGNISIPCNVEAAPLPRVEWLKNGGALGVFPGSVGGHVGMTIYNELVISDILYSDQGSYTCKASNENGEASNTTRVTVIEGISILVPPANTETHVNSSAFMYCQASYSNSLHYDLAYIWRFNGQIIDLYMSRYFIQSTREGRQGLSIRFAQFKHTGRYECEAKTTLHSAKASAMLTVKGPPGPPAGLYAKMKSVSSHNVTLIWTVGIGSDHGSPIDSYDVEAEMIDYHPGVWKTVGIDILDYDAVTYAAELSARGDQRAAVVNNLLPNIGYRFRVRAVNEFGRGSEASKPSAVVETPSTSPVKAPDRVGGGGGKVGTLVMTWKPLDPAERSGSGVGYHVYWKELDSPKDWFKVVVEDATTGNYSQLVGADYYYLQYEVKVGAFNDYGVGPNSSVKVIFSAEGIPVARPVMGDCDNYNGTAVSVTWTPVPDDREHMKGRIAGYRIQYYYIDEPDFIWNHDLHGQQEEAVLIGLMDNSNYWVRVMVFNSAAIGPIGEWRLAETFHLPPVEYPKHVAVWSNGPHSVRVTWQGVSTAFDEESLQGYILRVWKIQEDIRTANDTLVDKVMEAVVPNLQQKTVYVLRVLGYSLGGEGRHSPHVYFTVEGGNIPFDPTTTRYCFDDRACDSGATFLQFSPFIILLLALTSFIV